MADTTNTPNNSTAPWLTLGLLVVAIAAAAWWMTSHPATVVNNQPTSGNQTYHDSANGFSLTYPAASFTLASATDNQPLPWSYNSSATGMRLMTLKMVKDASLDKTNFADASVAVGVTQDAAAVASCTKPENGATATAVTLGGVNYTRLDSSDAGAGNLYQTKSYRLVQGNRCFAIESTIHSTNLGVYSPDQGITAFDAAHVNGLLDQVAATIHWD